MTTQMPSQADLAKTPGMLPPGDQIPDFDAPYNSLQIGTVISFAVTYFFVTVFLGLRYFQSFKLIQKIEIDLGKSSASNVQLQLTVSSHYYDIIWSRDDLFYYHGSLSVLCISDPNAF